MSEFRLPEGEVDERLYLQSVARALDVLESFGPGRSQMSLSEIAQAVGANKSAIQRTVQTLQARNYLRRGDQRGYMLGSRVLDLTFEYLRNHPYVIRVTPVMAELRRNVGERIDFSIFDYTTIIYAVRMQSKRETLNASLVGRRLFSFGTSGGRACLSLLPDEVVMDILERSPRQKFTPHTATEIPELMDRIRQAREDRYALAISEYLTGEIVIGAAIRGPNGFPVGAIHIAGMHSELSVDHMRANVAPLLMEAVRAVELSHG